MTIIPRHDASSIPCDVTLSWHLQSVERNAPSQGSSAIKYHASIAFHGGSRSSLMRVAAPVQNTGFQRLDRSNFCRLLAGWSFPRVQFRQEPARGISDTLKAFRWVLFHRLNSTERMTAWAARAFPKKEKVLPRLA